MSKELEKQTPEKVSQKKPVQEKAVKKEKQTPIKKTADESKNKTTLILFVLCLIIFSALSFFTYKYLSGLGQEIKQAELDADLRIKKLDERINDTSSRFTGIHEQLNALESKQALLEQIATKPDDQQIHINRDYALAEIEHLLIIASYNLALDHNVATALSAMEAADARLTGLNEPRAIEVREQLISDMNELRSLNQADLSGLGLYLSDLLKRVDGLPLKDGVVIETVESDVMKQEQQPGSVKQFFVLVWKELKSLVVITRDENVSKARLLPDEVYFIKSNIKLELANARFAVFNRDSENLNASIEHIQAWLNDYFDLSDADTRNIYDSLTKMKRLDLAFPKLDISSSLESVKALIRYQGETDSTPNQETIEPLQ